MRKLIVDRKWDEWVGNLGTQAAHQIIARGTADDEVWKAGIKEKLVILWKELGGSEAPMMEKLLMRRILNGWLSVHMLEIQQAVRPPAAIKEREYLDRSLSRAQKRYTEAITALGPSGSGKSTLLNILGWLDVLTAGTVRYLDQDLTAAGEAALNRYRREHVGFVFQFYNLIPSLTARENVALVTDVPRGR